MNKTRILTLMILGQGCALAGPPFVTDDPIPVDYQHWEVYLASQMNHNSDGWAGTLPHLEVNYGAAPDLQLHLIAPMSYVAPEHGTSHTGYGDTELGAKYRFLKESDSLPALATFPLVEVPTGDRALGLGSGHADIFLPLWLQKTFGKWTTYGGGGYWINPGEDNHNWWFTGLLLQRQITTRFALGAEIFHETSQGIGVEPDTKINAGGIWDINENCHILFSVGHSIQGPSSFLSYTAVQFTF
jgi:hypothetical protein